MQAQSRQPSPLYQLLAPRTTQYRQRSKMTQAYGQPKRQADQRSHLRNSGNVQFRTAQQDGGPFCALPVNLLGGNNSARRNDVVSQSISVRYKGVACLSNRNNQKTRFTTMSRFDDFNNSQGEYLNTSMPDENDEVVTTQQTPRQNQKFQLATEERVVLIIQCTYSSF